MGKNCIEHRFAENADNLIDRNGIHRRACLEYGCVLICVITGYEMTKQYMNRYM